MLKKNKSEKISSGVKGPVGFSLGAKDGGFPSEKDFSCRGKALFFLRNLSSTSSFLKFLIINSFLILTIGLVLTAMSYLKLRQVGFSGSAVKPEPDEKHLNPLVGYFEGPKFYREVDGVKQLQVIEGFVEEISLVSKFIIIGLNGQTEKISYSDRDVFVLGVLKQDPGDGFPLDYMGIEPSQIQVGDRIAYHPARLTFDRQNNQWTIQKKVR